MLAFLAQSESIPKSREAPDSHEDCHRDFLGPIQKTLIFNLGPFSGSTPPAEEDSLAATVVAEV